MAETRLEPEPEKWLDDVCQRISPEALVERRVFRGQAALTVDSAKLIRVMRNLRDQCSFDHLIDVTALDFLPREPRFQVVYHLWSHPQRRLLRVKAWAEGEPPAVRSLTALWSTADWHERECYDLFGIHFRGHPDLRRILTPEGWQGYPLRKDYPTEGPPEVQNWVPPRYGAQPGGDAD